MPTMLLDEIVESRIWSSGAEIVSHVNWSQIARVRRVLGTTGDELQRNHFEQLILEARPTLRLEAPLVSAASRAA
ncbi:MAG TPA: hypothetical protein VFU23_17180 [Gemmatimonadales bacterium]|nr:hypothetical protein [Gemmatimonadales bacterium]